MYDLFYILEVRPHFYNLCIRDTHYCIASNSDLEVLKKTIHKYVRKYKIEDRVHRALKGMESGYSVPPTVFEHRRAEYDSGKHTVFNDFIRGVVSEAIKENRTDTPYHHTKSKVKTLTHHTTVRTSPLPPENKVQVGKKITPRKIVRTTLPIQ